MKSSLVNKKRGELYLHKTYIWPSNRFFRPDIWSKTIKICFLDHEIELNIVKNDLKCCYMTYSMPRTLELTQQACLAQSHYLLVTNSSIHYCNKIVTRMSRDLAKGVRWVSSSI